MGLLMVAMTLGWAAGRAPGLLADLSSIPVGDWRVFVLARVSVIILAVYALVFVRTYHALVGVGMALTVAGLGLRIGLGQVTQEPLSLGFTLLLLALAVLPIRVIVRPNQDDTIRQQAEELARLKGETHEG
jgi:succinate dehydrogenase hydrophobic anchor subunit